MESHTHNKKKKEAKALSLAFWLNLAFSVIELVGGIFTNSTAIVADAFHDFMDAAAIGLAILMEKISGRKPSAKFSYGHQRFSLLSAVALWVFLLGGAVVMLISGYNSIIHPRDIHSVGMLWLAVLGLAVNAFAFLRIKKSGEDDHDHSHHHHHHSHNSQSIMLHLLEDVLGWAAVLVGAVVIYFTGWSWIDGVLAIAIGLFIGYNAIKNLISTFRVLLQSVPANVDLNLISTEITKLQGVSEVHHLHIWTLNGEDHVASVHAVIDENENTSETDLLTQIKAVFSSNGIHHATVQLETSENKCVI